MINNQLKNESGMLDQAIPSMVHGFKKFKERYKPIKHLGKGAFGSVFEVLDTHENITKALKIVNKYGFLYI